MDLRNGDCLALMKTLPDKSVDIFICDLPYGETNCKWDTQIDLEEFWRQFNRIRKSKKSVCMHFCSTKFGYNLIKSNEKLFKMDLVWKKRNKTGGLQSRYRPMRNHEMIYFFYEQAPKYNRDKYHKRIKAVPKYEKDEETISGMNKKENTHGTQSFEPIQPTSVLEEEKPLNNSTIGKKPNLNSIGIDLTKHRKYANQPNYTPLLPTSVLEEEDTMFGETKEERHKRYLKNGTGAYKPPQPGSVVEEETDIYGETKYAMKVRGKEICINAFDPPNPASVIEDTLGTTKLGECMGGKEYVKKMKEKGEKSLNGKKRYEPELPVSILDNDNELDIFDYIENPEEAPHSVFESKKVFIGKRNHQTEKPQDILEFFLKYWTDENDTVLDPTMGSGSTGVACKKMNRKFIGFELDEKIFEKAKNRINKS
jgi:DNA modification methylase